MTDETVWYVKVSLTILVILLFLAGRALAVRIIVRHARTHDIDRSRTRYTVKVYNFVSVLISCTILAIVWDVKFQHLSVFFASFLTVAGVALFAAWSILSNITASVILFFYHPMRIGERIRIMDGDNSVTGRIKDVTLFSILIETDEDRHILYPNNLAIQKPIELLRGKKIPAPVQHDEDEETPAGLS